MLFRSIAGLPGDPIEVEAEERGVQTQSGCRDRRLTARMATSHHYHVEGFGGGGAGDAFGGWLVLRRVA